MMKYQVSRPFITIWIGRNALERATLINHLTTIIKWM